MSPALKTRLIGASVLVAVAVIVVPLFFSAEPPQSGNEHSISLDIPAVPDREMQSRTLSVAPPTGDQAQPQMVTPDHLATVTIQSRKPKDVHPENVPTAPAATDQAATAPKPAAPSAAPTPAKPAPTTPKPPQPGKAAHGQYMISMGAYASRANAEKLVAGVRKLGYPVGVDAVSVGGKPAARVQAGPFDSRAAAEAARLKIKAALPRAPATLVSGATDQKGDVPAADGSKPRAGGWAVQIGAYSSRDDALKLRDRLRAGGFDGYVDDVTTGGRKLWRVRVGPQTQRDDAVRVGMQVKQKMKLPVAVVTVP